MGEEWFKNMLLRCKREHDECLSATDDAKVGRRRCFLPSTFNQSFHRPGLAVVCQFEYIWNIFSIGSNAGFVIGHGDVANVRDVQDFRDYLLDLRRLVRKAGWMDSRTRRWHDT